MLKICKKCGLAKDTKKFYNNKLNKDGLYSYCKECKKAYQNEKYIKKEDKKIMTLKDKIYNELKNKKVMTLSTIKEKFGSKAPVKLIQLVSQNKIGSSETVSEGLKYYIK